LDTVLTTKSNACRDLRSVISRIVSEHSCSWSVHEWGPRASACRLESWTAAIKTNSLAGLRKWRKK